MRPAASICALLLLTGCNRSPGHLEVLVATNTATKGVPLTSEPSHHFVFANDYVRVFRVEAAPGASTLVHRHDNDYFWVSLGPSDITNRVTGQPPVHAEIADGEVRFVAGGFDHSVTNNSRQPFRNFTIEVLKHGSRALKPGEDEHEMTLLNAGSIERLLLRDGIRVSELELTPGAEVSRQKTSAHLVLVLAGSEIWIKSCSSRRAHVAANCGDDVVGANPASPQSEFRWRPDSYDFESFRNAGKTSARLLLLDF
jgi:hypothetical protein